MTSLTADISMRTDERVRRIAVVVETRFGPQRNAVTVVALFLLAVAFELSHVDVFVATLAAAVVKRIATIQRSVFVGDFRVARDARLGQMRADQRVAGFFVIRGREQRGEKTVFVVACSTRAPACSPRELAAVTILVAVAAFAEGELPRPLPLNVAFAAGNPGVKTLQRETGLVVIEVLARDVEPA